MDYSTARSIVDDARRLYQNGQSESAIQKLNAACNDGSIDAMIELAHIARAENKKAESDQWIDKAESALKLGDLDGHLSLNGAYSLGLGHGEPDFLEKRALHHMEQVALAGNSTAQESLALQFLFGLNGCEKDVRRFEYWIGLAINAGSPRAVFIYADYLFKEGRHVASDIVEKLNAVRSENKAAEKLLNKISKREKNRLKPL